MKRVLSYGGGVQTTALALMILELEIERPDLVIFADTQREPPAVYRQVKMIFDRLLQIDVDCIIVSNGDLGAFDENGSLHVPLRTVSLLDQWVDVTASDGTVGKEFRPAGSEGLLFRTCTSRFKTQVIEQELRARDWKAEGVEMWLGISLDEVERMKPNPLGWIRNRWPLIDLHIRRSDCEKYLRDRGFEIVKSACYFCPNRSRGAWRALDAESRRLAIEYDASIRDVRPGFKSYVHRDLVPLQEALATTDQQLDLFEPAQDECSGRCFT